MFKRIFISALFLATSLISATNASTVAVIETKYNTKININESVDYYFCNNSSCVKYLNGPQFDEHADKVVRVLKNAAVGNVDVMLFTGNSQTALNWIDQNAQNHNIRVVNMSFSSSSNPYYARLRGQGVYVVGSTGNGGRNGFL